MFIYYKHNIYCFKPIYCFTKLYIPKMPNFTISAVICEFESIVKTLLSAGAKTNLTDNEGNIPSDVTSQSKFLEMLSAR